MNVCLKTFEIMSQPVVQSVGCNFLQL